MVFHISSFSSITVVEVRLSLLVLWPKIGPVYQLMMVDKCGAMGE
jgi:hypothetical protein